jgi:hypothetical protein
LDYSPSNISRVITKTARINHLITLVILKKGYSIVRLCAYCAIPVRVN